jgi:cytochrome c553
MNKLTIAALLASSILLAAPTHAADVAAGKARAQDSCVDCHGDDGKGDDENPSIAGMPVEKFTKAIEDFRAGTRSKSAKMVKEAKKLSPAEIADLAAYFATLK